jgi:serine/threonine protein kinase
MVGTVVGQYRIVAPIGRGTTGIVYRAIDESLGREVAIKILNPDLAGTEVMKRFRTEATALARLNHPAIATVYQLFRAGTDLLMVMEFVRGETLEHLSQRLGPLEPDRAAYLIDQLLWGVGHAHAGGIVHRDLKPANVMLTPAGAIKIMDFGIARVRGTEQVTADGSMLGTPAYMAPEQITGGATDARADLYSIGVIFYRLLTATLPFQVETPMQMLQRQIADPPDPLHTHRPELPHWCQMIVDRALAKSPEHRFQTADEFRDALAHGARILTRTDLAADLAQLDEEPASTHAVDGFAAFTSTLDGGTAVIRKPPQRAWLAAAAAIVALIGMAGYVGLRREAPEPASALASGARTGAPVPYSPSPTTPPASAVAPLSAPISTSALQPTSGPATTPAVVKAAAPLGGRTSADTPRVDEPVRASAPLAHEPEDAPSARPERAPVFFETKTLLSTGKNHKERDAKVALADGKIRVATDADGKQQVLHSVSYENIASISYSRGRDPVWMSPHGPATVARMGAGAFGIFRRERHWITLETSRKGHFVVLRTSESTAGKVLAELEARTGRRAQVVNARGRS